MKKRLKINGLVMFLATVILAIFPALFFRRFSPGIVDSALEIFGLAFIFLGQLIRVSARGFKSENSRNGCGLVKDGPYSLVRNPMYLGIILIGLGVVLMLFKLWVAIIFLGFFAVRYALLIHEEEKKLKVLFNGQYAGYCQEVPSRVLPSIKALLEKDICEYLPLKFKWIRKEIGSIIALLSLVIVIESWEDLRRGGVIFFLSELSFLAAIFILFLFLAAYLISITGNINDADKGKDNL